MNKLSDYQRRIVILMTKGAVLKTTEGRDYKVWLVYPDGLSESIRKDTANKLYMMGYITPLLNSKNTFYFEYGYTGKKVL